jgi:signal transduction histidine kinase
VQPGGKGLRGWHGRVAADSATRKQAAVDLGRVVALDEVRLIPASRDGVPRPFEYGLPARFRIEVSAAGGEQGWTALYDRTDRSLQTPGGNVQCFRADGVQARYLRVSASRLREWTGECVMALGELQAYAGDDNVAFGAKGLAEESLEDAEWGLAGLTDGRVAEGKLLEWPQWLHGLVRRQVLDRRRAEVARRHSELLVRAEHWLVGTSVGATCLIAVLTGVLSWRGRRQRRVEFERHRERLARDLHDELGSNLGSIALISSCALQGRDDPVQMRSDLEEIELVARASADSMRDMVELLGAKRGGAASDWLGVLRGLADRLLRGVELECGLPDGPLAREPDLETRREIYLFCKEVLHNIARHAHASRVRFHVRSTAAGMQVTIADDGCGFDPAAVAAGHGLGNLRERAGGLRGRMDLVSKPGGGTVVTLEVPRGRRWRKPSVNRSP